MLRGPQGTLYGRNATGGSINVISRKPTSRPAGYVDVTLGNYGRVAVEAALSGPLVDGVSARIAVITNNRGGYGKNEFTGNGIDDANQRGARAMVRIAPSDAVTLDLAADFYREDDHAYGIHYFGQYNPATPLRGITLGGRAPSRLRNVNNDQDPTNRRELYGFSGTATFELGDITLRSISAYRHSDYTVFTELDQTEQVLSYFPFFEKARQLSQELQLSGSLGPVEFIVGAYYFDENIDGGSQVTRNLRVVGGADRMTNGYKVQGFTKTRASAVFGQIDYAITDQLKLVAGARYSYEKVRITDQFQLDFVRTYVPGAPIVNLPGFPRSDRTSEGAFTPKFGVEFTPVDDILLYATYSKGFKSGGFNLGVNRPAFDPESISSYETGIKLTTLDRRLRINAAGFYYDYKNLQVSKVINSVVVTENAASAKLYGAEVEFTALPTTALQFDGTFSYLHSEYKDFSSLDPARAALGVQNLEGNRLTQAPKVTLNLGAQYALPLAQGSLTLRGELNYVSRVFFTAFNDRAVGQAANTKYNAYLTFESEDGQWRASLFGRNLTDKVTRANGLVSSAIYGSPITGSVSAPRTFGARIGYSF